MRPEFPPVIGRVRFQNVALCGRLIQTFVAKTPVEAFHEGVLGRLARRDLMPGEPAVLRPLQDRDAG